MSRFVTRSIILNKQRNISTNSNEINVVLPSVCYLENSEVALKELYIYYSWFNITSQFNNKSFQYIWNDAVTYDVNVPDGFYSPADLTGYLEYVMTQNGHYLVNQLDKPEFYIRIVENSVYYANTLEVLPIPASLPSGWTNPNAVTLDGNTPQLIVPANNNFGKLFGMNAGTYPPTPLTIAYSKNSDFVPTVSPVTAIHLTTNLANSGTFNDIPGIINTFTSGDTSFGGQIRITPPDATYYPINDGRYANINVRFFDDENRPLDIKDANVIVTLSIRTWMK